MSATASAHTIGSIGRRYVLQDVIGKGGMGIVYRALDRLTGKIVALKRVNTNPEQLEFNSKSSASLDSRVALAQEFKVLASLRHPNIISVLDYGFDSERQPYITMELLENQQNILEAGQNSTASEKLDLLVQTLQALAYLHRRGVLHRDLKPGNVLVTEGRVRVLDFGLAVSGDALRSAGAGQEVVGTLAYISPEVLRGEIATTASDLYAVGVIAYEMFAGRHPFQMGDLSKLLSEILNSNPDLTPIDLFTSTKSFPKLSESETDTFKQAAVTAAIAALDDTLKLRYLKTLDQTLKDQRIALDQLATATEVARVARNSPLAGRTLSGIISRLLSKFPEIRYADSTEVIFELCAAMNEPPPPESREIRESFLQAAQFVGRDSELKTLLKALEQSGEGLGSLWLIGGSSGIGKSRLVEELRVQAVVRGATVLRGQTVREQAQPYIVWQEPLRWLSVLDDKLSDLELSLLKPIIPDLENLVGHPIPNAPEVEAQDRQNRLLAALEAIILRQPTPMLIILEDLQWASAETLAVIKRLIPQLPKHNVLLLGTFRDDERADLPDLLLGANSLRLKRLDETAISVLSTSMLGEGGRTPEVINFLQRETEGNVFFLVEVVRALAENAGNLSNIALMTLPKAIFSGGIAQVISRRLGRVPMEAQPLLRLAAVAGRTLDLKLLGTTEEYPGALDEWLTRCSNAAVLEFGDNQWRFSHDKLREAILNELESGERRVLNQRVALLIERLYSGDRTRAVTLMEHWRVAGDSTKEYFYAKEAGEQAIFTGSFYQAATFFERAIQLMTPQVTDSEQAALYIACGNGYYATSEFEKAETYLERGAQLLKWNIKPRNLALSVLWQFGRQAAQRFRERFFGLPILTVDPLTRQAETRLATLAILYFLMNRSLQALNMQLLYTNRVTRFGPSSDSAFGFATLSYVMVAIRQNGFAEYYLKRAKQEARESQSKSAEASALQLQGAFYVGVGRWKEADHLLAEGANASKTLGNWRTAGEIFIYQAEWNYYHGDYATARRIYDETELAGHRAHNRLVPGWAAMGYGMCDFRQGQTELALSAFEDVLPLMTELKQHRTLVSLYGLMSLCHLRREDYPNALKTMAAGEETFRKNVPVPNSYFLNDGYWGLAYSNLILLERLGQGIKIERPVEEIEKSLKYLLRMYGLYRGTFLIGTPGYYFLKGYQARLKKQPESAARWLTKGIAATQKFPLRYEAGLLNEEMALSLPTTDSRWKPYHEQAIALFTEIGADYELRRIGVQK
jgi:serine/threonine protein kinase